MSFEEGMSCTNSLVDALEGQGGFHPIETRKRLEPGEGLTKIWMCSSSEMGKALFSTKPDYLQLTNNLGRESLNLIDKLTSERNKSIDSDEESQSSSASEWTNEIDLDQSVISSLALAASTQESSKSSEVSSKDERIDNVKRSLKEMYHDKLEAGANILINYSLEMLDQRMYNLVKQIRIHEANSIASQLKPVVDFIEKYKIEVNRENGYMLKRKYRMERRAGITRLIDAAEESFTHRCLQIEKKLLENYNFRVEILRNKYYINYRESLRSDLNKWIGRFKAERNKIMEEYETAAKLIKDKYNKLYEELKANEESKVKEELNKIQEIMTKFKITAKEEPREPYMSCCEESGWLCVLHQLLTDMQLFIKTYISSEADVRMLLNKIKQNKTSNYRHKSKVKSRLFRPSMDDEITLAKEGSVITIPCITNRNEELHQELIQEAGVILEKILSDISQGIVTKEDFDLIWRRIYKSSLSDILTSSLIKHFQSDEDYSRFNFQLFN